MLRKQGRRVVCSTVDCCVLWVKAHGFTPRLCFAFAIGHEVREAVWALNLIDIIDLENVGLLISIFTLKPCTTR